MLPRLQVKGHCFWSFAQAHLSRVLHVLALFIILGSTKFFNFGEDMNVNSNDKLECTTLQF